MCVAPTLKQPAFVAVSLAYQKAIEGHFLSCFFLFDVIIVSMVLSPKTGALQLASCGNFGRGLNIYFLWFLCDMANMLLEEIIICAIM